MRFAFNTALLLAICHTTLWGKSESPSHPSPNSLEWRRWIQGDVTLGGFELRSDFRGSAYGDFNADGWDDILMLTPTRVHVAWNGPDGLGSFQALSEASGEIQHGFWDGASLWVALAYPHRLECWSIGENGTDRRHVWSGRMETLRPCPQGGILVLRNEGTQLVHLQRDGSATTLISDAASCADAALLSSGVLLVQDDASGALGISQLGDGVWGNVQWLAGTEGTKTWDLLVRPNGQSWLLGRDAENIWFQALSPGGDVDHAWRSHKDLRDFDFWLKPTTMTDAVEVVVRGIVTYDMHHVVFDLATGQERGRFNLEEIDGIPALLMPDLDKDGVNDLIYPAEEAGRWSYALSWEDGTRRLLWRKPGQSAESWPSEIGLPQAWMEALGPLDEAEEVWTHNGELLVRRKGRWQALQAKPHPQPGFKTREQQVPNESCFQLFVPYLNVGWQRGNDVYPSLGELKPKTWHHVVFQRSNNLDTEVWLDGTCVFRGKSDDADYMYNALLFGAAYGTSYVSFGALSLDRIILSGRPWNEAEIQAEARGDWVDADRYTTDWWDFESLPAKGELTDRPADPQSSPRLTPGIHGNAVTFDGKDDALRSFAAVPSEHLTLSFHMRLNDPHFHQDQAAVTLYGMHNTMMVARWANFSHIGRPQDSETTLTSPSYVQSRDLGLPEGSSLVHTTSEIRALDSEGQFWRPGALGWERMPSKPEGEHPKGREMWFNDGQWCVMDVDGRVWLETEIGWDKNAKAWSTQAIPEVVNTRNGTFFADSTLWIWCDAFEAPTCWEPTESMPAPTSLAWSPFGDVVTFGDQRSSLWHPQKRTLRLEPSRWGFQTETNSRWMWLALLVCLAGASVWWHRRSDPPASTAPPLSWETLPAGLAPTMQKLTANPTFQVDTLVFDQLIGQNEHESYESKRARRSRFIRECNQWSQGVFGVEAIQRTQDLQDRRRTLYSLHPTVADALNQMSEGGGSSS